MIKYTHQEEMTLVRIPHQVLGFGPYTLYLAISQPGGAGLCWTDHRLPAKMQKRLQYCISLNMTFNLFKFVNILYLK